MRLPGGTDISRTRPIVVIAEKLAPAGVELLSREFTVESAVGDDRARLLRRLEGAAGLVVRSATKVDAELIEAAPLLQVIGRAGIGVDNIDVAAATAAGVLVANAPDANVISAAEHTIALLLAQARRIAQADRSMRDGRWERARFQGVELHGKTLGVIGLGRVGTLVAERATAFGMRLVAFDPYVGEERMRRLRVEMAGTLAEVLACADFVTVHLPLTKETKGLIGRDELAAAKPGVRLVNTSRGGVIDEAALVDAVRAGTVAGAALDVFAEEPLRDSPLRDLPEIVLTPHLGASTREAQDKAGVAVAEAVAAALRGELVPAAVNLDLGRGLEPGMRPFAVLAERLGSLFVGFSRALPEALTVRIEGRLTAGEARPFTLSALKGALGRVSERVTYVNVLDVASQHGIAITEEVARESADYHSVVRVAGTVGGRPRSFTGTVMDTKGPALVEVNGYEVELPLTRYLLLVRNADVPGVIGRLGTYLGDAGVNIANMVVGRDPTGEAMMGLNLDDPLDDDQVAGILALEGIADARFVELGPA